LHAPSEYSKICRAIQFHFESAKALRLIQQKISLHTFLLFNFYEICMVGVKKIIVNCAILLTPKSTFFQPTRVVFIKQLLKVEITLHKTWQKQNFRCLTY
uniref:Uncharacterized protein n=1 Tax=Vombatus ursinus TaxID=29139 RepID=A0A4X2L6K9_VOMUR